jgi:hypothetical protein
MTEVKVSPEILAKLVADAVAAMIAGKADTAKANGKAKSQDERVKRDVSIAKAFEKAGYKNIRLFDTTKTLAEQLSDVTILTYNKWVEIGRKVKPGEHAVKVRGYHIRLFHKSQTEVMDPETRKAEFKKMEEAIKRYEAKKAGGEQAKNA